MRLPVDDGLGPRGKRRARRREWAIANLQFNHVLAAGFEFLGDGKYVERGFAGQAARERGVGRAGIAHDDLRRAGTKKGGPRNASSRPPNEIVGDTRRRAEVATPQLVASFGTVVGTFNEV